MSPSSEIARTTPGRVDNGNYQPQASTGYATAERDHARGTVETLHADELPKIASLWLMSYKSAHTRRSYAKAFTGWALFLDDLRTPIHPFKAKRPHADAWMRELEEGKRDPDGGGFIFMPLAPASVAHHLAAASSFYRYAISIEAAESNPFASINRPNIDPDYSAVEGLTEDDTARLIAAAADSSPRAYALVVLLYTTGVRVNGAFAANVEDIGVDRGHNTLTVTLKGATKRKSVLAPLAFDALTAYLDGRTEGPLFTTSTGRRMGQTEAWKCLRRVAKRAGIPQAATIHPHVLRHAFITDSLEQGIPLHKVQDAAGHKDPRTTRRYDTARNQLNGHPAYAVAESMAEKLDR